MPVYEYLCEACHQPFEAIQKFSDSPIVDCENCGAKGAVKKLVSKSSFALKGSGWYTTDYKRAPKPVEKTAEVPKIDAAKSESGPSEAAKPAAPAPSAAAADAKPKPKSEPVKPAAPKSGTSTSD